jgi:hypothetical protein
VKLFGRGKPESMTQASVQRPEPEEPIAPPGVPWSGVRIENGELRVSWDTPAEAKQVIKELRLKKSEVQIEKRAITSQQQQLRAAHTDRVRHHAPAMRGGGTLGRVVRGAQVGSHAAERKQLADALAPLEQRKAAVEALILTIDRALLQVQASLSEPS